MLIAYKCLFCVYKREKKNENRPKKEGMAILWDYYSKVLNHIVLKCIFYLKGLKKIFFLKMLYYVSKEFQNALQLLDVFKFVS